MPSSKNYKRDYKEEYKVSQSSPREKKSRAMRNAARRELMKEGRVEKHDGKDVDHKTPIAKGGGNKRSNLRVQSKSANRSFKRTKSARMA
jgi:5-methylcytosine-specific restriction endonuclease McrA